MIPATRKTTKLRQLLESEQLEFIVEAHNGISALIAEEAGFRGIWASGLALSAQFGVRDCNETSWTQVVDMVEFMTDATTAPILLDGDTGFGNFNNLRRLVRKLEQRGVAGVCIEDKIFPKTNSFINGSRQELACIDEFCGKIAAGKDSQLDSDFCIVARVEAYIAGWGTREAMRRAEAYLEAGADAILIHSADKQPHEILEFAELWNGRCPLVIVPTKYYRTPTHVFRDAGVSLVVWANHLLRSSVAAMQATASRIAQDESLLGVEENIAPMREIFRLQGAQELEEAERRYLACPPTGPANAIILAATQGEDFGGLTQDRPKIMLPVNGTPLLSWLVGSLGKQGTTDITVVGGFRCSSIDTSGVRLIENSAFESTGELVSFDCARESLRDDTVVMYGDLLFRDYILAALMDAEDELTIVVDSQMSSQEGPPHNVVCSAPDDLLLMTDSLLRSVTARDQPTDECHGRWIGMLRAQGNGIGWIEEALDVLRTDPEFDRMDMGDLLNHLVEAGRPVNVVYIQGHWVDVNNLTNLMEASGLMTS